MLVSDVSSSKQQRSGSTRSFWTRALVPFTSVFYGVGLLAVRRQRAVRQNSTKHKRAVASEPVQTRLQCLRPAALRSEPDLDSTAM